MSKVVTPSSPNPGPLCAQEAGGGWLEAACRNSSELQGLGCNGKVFLDSAPRCNVEGRTGVSLDLWLSFEDCEFTSWI
jgi:hypothetical protein